MDKQPRGRRDARNTLTPEFSQIWLPGPPGMSGVVVAYITVGAAPSRTSYPDLLRAHSGDIVIWVVRNADRHRRTVSLTNFKVREGGRLHPQDPLEDLTPDRTAAVNPGDLGLIAAKVRREDRYQGRYKYTIEISGRASIDPDLDITPPLS